MSTLNNHTAVVRIAGDRHVNHNQDGSATVLFAGYAQNDFTNREGEVTSELINFNYFIPASRVKKSGLGIAEHIYKGDMFAVQSRVGTDSYTDKAGNQVYKMVLKVESIKALTPKAESQARRGQTSGDNQAQAGQQGQAAPAQGAQNTQQGWANQAPQAQNAPVQNQAPQNQVQQNQAPQPQHLTPQPQQAPQGQTMQYNQQPQQAQFDYTDPRNAALAGGQGNPQFNAQGYNPGQ